MKNLNKHNKHLIQPHAISGFTDADGCFYINIQHDPKSRFGLRLIPIFYITQDADSLDYLNTINFYFNNKAKLYYRQSDNTYTLTIKAISNCISILSHFDEYILHSEKNKNYQIWKYIVHFLNNKQHLNLDGLISIIELIFKMNTKGKQRKYSLKYYKNFLNIQSIKTLPFKYKTILEPLNVWYITGLIDGDGSFNLSWNKKRIRYNFTIGMLLTPLNKQTLQNLQKYFKCGSIYLIKQNFIRYQVTSKNDLIKYILPHFDKYPLQTNKKKHYNILKKVLKDQKNINWEQVYNINKQGKRRKYEMKV